MVNGKTIHLDEDDGYELAADLLREIEGHWNSRSDGVDDEELDDLWKHEESAILRRYLQMVGERHCPALEKGFFAVLTDFIGSALGGGVREVESYRRDWQAAGREE